MHTQILDKIKKLLALANSPVEAEATAAYNKARAMMAQYAIDDSDVEAHSSVKIVSQDLLWSVFENMAYQFGTPLDNVLMYHTNVAYFTECVAVSHANVKLEFWGADFQIDIFKYLCESLINQGLEARKQAIELHGKHAYFGFWPGYFDGLSNRFFTLRKQYQAEQTEGLVLVDKVLAHVKGVYPGLGYSRDLKPVAGNEFGYNAAQEVSLGAGLGSGMRVIE